MVVLFPGSDSCVRSAVSFLCLLGGVVEQDVGRVCFCGYVFMYVSGDLSKEILSYRKIMEIFLQCLMSDKAGL